MRAGATRSNGRAEKDFEVEAASLMTGGVAPFVEAEQLVSDVRDGRCGAQADVRRDAARDAVGAGGRSKTSPMGPQSLGSPPLPHLLTADEVAGVIRTSRRVIYEMTRLGQLPGVIRVGRKLLFRRDRLLEFLLEREEQPVSSLGGKP